ncbi:MAG: hypothetical protein F4Y02_06590 [Chloroflexi bacterium]|nr:hypothetical protein [Chloroflexota bacterium]
MPELNRPTGRTAGPLPYDTLSPRNPAAVADKIVTTTAVPDASTGNTVEDHIRELLARSGHETAEQYQTEHDYAVGDEVYWTDGSSITHIYFRLTAGRDPAGSTPAALTGVWREVVNDLRNLPVDGDGDASKALVVREAGHGGVRAEVAPWTKLQASQSEAEVNALIAAAGYLTRGQIQTLIAGYGYRTAQQVSAAIAAATGNFRTAAQVRTLIEGYSYQTAAQVNALIAAHPSTGTDWLGRWTAIPANADIVEGQFTEHLGDFYISRTNHQKGSAPDSDATNWALLNNWAGLYDDSRWYHEGAIVVYGLSSVWIADRHVTPSDPEPGASRNTKWKRFGENTLNKSLVRMSENDALSVASPGTHGVWAGASIFPRGLPGEAGVSFGASRPQGHASDLAPVTVSSDLEDLIEIRGNLLVFDESPFELEVTIHATILNALAGNTVRFTLNYHHLDGSEQTLIQESPAIPGDTSSSNPFEFTAGRSDTSDTLRMVKGDSLRLSFEHVSGTTGDAVLLAALQNVRVDIKINGESIDPENYDTYPVQSRPVRDLTSFDRTEASAIVYRNSERREWRSNIDRDTSALWKATGPAGSGFRLQSATRDVSSESENSEVLIDAAATYDFDFSGRVTFNDLTLGPSNPDDLDVQLLHIAAAHAGSLNSWPADSDMTFLARQKIFDIAAVTGTDADVVFAPQGTGNLRQISPTIPATLDDGHNHRFVQWWTTTRGTPNRPQLRVAGDRTRWRLTAYIRFTGDPGGNTAFYSRSVSDNKTSWHWLPHTGSPTSPNTLEIPLYDSGDTSSYQSRDGGEAHGANQRIWEFWFGFQSGDRTYDWDNIDDITIRFETWGEVDGNRDVHLVANSLACAVGDVVAVRINNATDYSASDRMIRLDNGQMSVANSQEVAGRKLSLSGSASGAGVIAIANVASTNWLAVIRNQVIARRDVRRLLFELSVTTAQARTVTIWREASGFGTREIVKRQQLPGSGSAQKISGHADAVVASEAFWMEVDGGGISGNFTAVLSAQTPDDIPSRQVRIEGLMRATRIIDAGDLGVGIKRWTRLPLRGGWHWNSFPSIRIYVKLDESNDFWVPLPSIDTQVLDAIGDNPGSGSSSILGQSITGAHKSLEFPIQRNAFHNSGNRLYIAALNDGDLAIFCHENPSETGRPPYLHVYGIKGYGE